MYRSKIIISILIVITIFGGLVNNTKAFAEIDLTHDYKEDEYLLDNNKFVGSCKNGKLTCVKNLVRYDGVLELVDFLEDLKKNAKDDTKDTFLKNLLESLGLFTATVGFYQSPFKTFKATLAIDAFCHAEKDIVKPIGETAGYFSKLFVNLKAKLFREEKVERTKGGLNGKFVSLLCGGDSADWKEVVISKEKKRFFIDNILKDLKSKIKQGKWKGNDIIVLSVDLDPDDLQFGLEFEPVGFYLHYDKPLYKYFENIDRKYFWKIW